MHGLVSRISSLSGAALTVLLLLAAPGGFGQQAEESPGLLQETNELENEVPLDLLDDDEIVQEIEEEHDATLANEVPRELMEGEVFIEPCAEEDNRPECRLPSEGVQPRGGVFIGYTPFKIQNERYGVCLKARSKTLGARVTTSRCYSTTAYYWQPVYKSGGVLLQNLYSKYCLRVKNNKLYQSSCQNYASRRWEFRQVGHWSWGWGDNLTNKSTNQGLCAFEHTFNRGYPQARTRTMYPDIGLACKESTARWRRNAL